MNFPELSNALRLARLEPPAGRIRMVLDTDTYNEIDDQFAVVYALLSPDKLNLEAIYAAPFYNSRSSGPGDGMEKSYQEILRLLERLDVSPAGFVFRGSSGFLPDWDHPHRSEAALDLVARAMSDDEQPLYVLAIGAITNVASAILIEPRIVERIVVVWLGGQPLHWPHTREFNLGQDVQAARVILDSGVPLVQIPCSGVASHLLTTVAEIERYVEGQGAIGDYLAQIFKAYHVDHFAWSKVIWDISGVAWLLDGSWVPTEVVHSPLLTDQVTWSVDRSRHFVRFASYVNRDPIFRDLFAKLAQKASG
ncbi:MAG: nucleoside hydrolase [Anaerolineae bacterium]|nr:nucleoside hydrolase [Anaerolineae bacterium]